MENVDYTNLARTGGVTILALPFVFIFVISIKQLLESLISHLKNN